MKCNILKWAGHVALCLLFVHQSHSFTEFQCSRKKGDSLPSLPPSFSTDVRINFLNDGYSVDAKHATISNGEKEYMEFTSKTRHVKYIIRKDQKQVLIINYNDDDQPTCTVTYSLDVDEFMDSKDAGSLKILSKFIVANADPTSFNLVGPREDNGMIALRWEGCLRNPRINVSYSFAPNDWGQPYYSSLVKDAKYLVSAFAQIDSTEMSLSFTNFDPRVPDETIFQPPADVYCEGFRAQKKPPNMPNFFSYTAEILTYESAEGVSPLVSNRKVYYDKTDEISRMDLYDPIAQDSDMFSSISASEKTVIDDFNAGIRYSFDSITGKCQINTLKNTWTVAYSFDGNTMANGNKFFLADVSRSSYNGQFPVRGMMADVYTAKRLNEKTNKMNIITWYFSTEETRIVENEKVEKNVLLRMTVRPETSPGKEDLTEINFYNFAREQPNVFAYDLSGCFNDSYSKFMILTFPANDLLRGSEKHVGMHIHLALRNTLQIRKQRISVKEVVFSGNYMFAEFALFGIPPIANDKSAEITLDEAMKKLQNAISENSFAVFVSSGDNTIVLKPEPDGLNEISKNRRIQTEPVGYNEGSVISLTIGMLFLGVLLGGVALNLVMSKKFGVSLFQKSNYGNQPFVNSFESSM